jgi:hypothetical protein
MILLGIFTTDNLTTITGSIEQIDGQIEKGILGIVCPDPLVALSMALVDCKALKARTPLRMYTNDAQLLKFLTPPISIAPTRFKTIRGWGKVGWGGDVNQWGIMHGLASFDRWSISQAAKLPGTEAIYNEYRQSNCHQDAVRPGVADCYQRLYAGLWTATRYARW